MKHTDWLVYWFADWLPGREETEGGAGGGAWVEEVFFRVGGGVQHMPGPADSLPSLPIISPAGFLLPLKEGRIFFGRPVRLGPGETCVCVGNVLPREGINVCVCV